MCLSSIYSFTVAIVVCKYRMICTKECITELMHVTTQSTKSELMICPLICPKKPQHKFGKLVRPCYDFKKF